MSLAGLTILVTRPQGQAAALLAAISAAGGSAVHYPVLQITALDTAHDGAAMQHCKQLIMNLDQYQHIIFISANAVNFGMEWINQYWPQLPVDVAWYGIGNSTVAALESAGVVVNRAAANATMDSEGLLQHPALQSLKHEKILIVRGVGGREYLAEQLSARGAVVDYAQCYRRSIVEQTLGDLTSVVKKSQVDIICVNSVESLQNLIALAGEQVAIMQSKILLLPGQRVAEFAKQQGFINIAIADNASDQAVLARLLTLAK